MSRVPEWPDPYDTDLYRPTPAAPPWPDAIVTEKEPPPVPPTRQPDRFGFQPKRGHR